jgi:hypothetical protein
MINPNADIASPPNDELSRKQLALSKFTEEELELKQRWESGETIVIHKGRHRRILSYYKGQGILKPICDRSPFANPKRDFDKNDDQQRAEAITEYRKHLASKPELLSRVEELRGKILMCYCHPQPCHSDVLLEILNRK